MGQRIRKGCYPQAESLWNRLTKYEQIGQRPALRKWLRKKFKPGPGTGHILLHAQTVGGMHIFCAVDADEAWIEMTVSWDYQGGLDAMELTLTGMPNPWSRPLEDIPRPMPGEKWALALGAPIG
jgi:hypothetical protein